jgi:hypothetical protein
MHCDDLILYRNRAGGFPVTAGAAGSESAAAIVRVHNVKLLCYSSETH